MDRSELKNILSALCAADGVSGAEENAAAVCAKYLSAYGETQTDAFNNVICKVGSHTADKPTVMIEAHIDEIGMIVNHITDDGFLRVSKCGGIDERVLPAAEVTIYGKEKLSGVVTSVPPHLQTEHKKAAKLDDLYIDTGLSGARAKELISLGDRVLIENTLADMGGLVTSKALDDRACVCALIRTLDLLKGRDTAYNISAAVCSGEEVGSRGAKVTAFCEQTDISLIMDVSFGRVHDESDEDTGEVGGGAMIGISPVLSRRLSNALIETAKTEQLPYQIEVMGGRTGTDADEAAAAGKGSAACTLSIPIRNMHTPVEAADLGDIENTARLAAAFCERGLF